MQLLKVCLICNRIHIHGSPAPALYEGKLKEELGHLEREICDPCEQMSKEFIAVVEVNAPIDQAEKMLTWGEMEKLERTGNGMWLDKETAKNMGHGVTSDTVFILMANESFQTLLNLHESNINVKH